MGGIVEENGAEDGLFGFDIGWQSSVEGEVGEGGHMKSLGRKAASAAVEICARFWKTGDAAGGNREQGTGNRTGLLGS